jgi:hypothetical protein
LEVDPAKQKQIFAQLNSMLLDQTFVTYSAHEGFVDTGAWLDNAST